MTERQPLENLTETRRVIAALQGLGVQVAIDDVGTGHSGLSYMLKLGVDIIKIDKMFIDSLGTDRNSNTIIETLIDLAQNMRMEIIAEGVESFEQVVHLRELGIRAAQGYVFSPPLPGSAFLQLVEAIDPLKSRRASADEPGAAIAALARTTRPDSGQSVVRRRRLNCKPRLKAGRFLATAAFCRRAGLHGRHRPCVRRARRLR